MGSIKTQNIIQLEKRMSSIKWQTKFHIINEYNKTNKIQSKNLDYWLHYPYSMTTALTASRFHVELLFNQEINHIWYRHVMIYVKDKPFMYAITTTKQPEAFSLGNLGNKSIGTKLFNSYIKHNNFIFAKTNILQSWLQKFCNICINNNQSMQNIIVRKRRFICLKSGAKLELKEFF